MDLHESLESVRTWNDFDTLVHRLQDGADDETAQAMEAFQNQTLEAEAEMTVAEAVIALSKII